MEPKSSILNTMRTIFFMSLIIAMIHTAGLADESGCGDGGDDGCGGDDGSGGHGGGGGGGCGDVFGNLVHIKRDPVTGQPILLKRWIEVPGGIEDWGYCPIPVDASGQEIEMIDFSCDPAIPEDVVELDYFGRLSGGRTKERNNRMHFNEVISSIKMADAVRQDETGRLRLGYGCDASGSRCENWSTVDSPQANLALYTRLMRYGHIQTSPDEVDESAHGDPALGTQYHPALDPSVDWSKLHSSVRHLLPAQGCTAPCAAPEELDKLDFVRAASFLAGAADKYGEITVDLVQYMNRILKITSETPMSKANIRTLSALIMVCDEEVLHPQGYDDCPLVEADSSLEFPANELFVDFGQISYRRSEFRKETIDILLPAGKKGQWQENKGIQLLGWLNYVNGREPRDPVDNLPGFVDAANDALRSIQLLHDYKIPEDLGWNGR